MIHTLTSHALCEHYSGGELEYVEELSGRCWAIDWNPRFPSWIFAATFTPSACNLPALLVNCAARGVLDESISEPVIPSFDHVSFTKTVIEVPRANHHLNSKHTVVLLCADEDNGSAAGKGYHSAQRETADSAYGRHNPPVAVAEGYLHQLCRALDAELLQHGSPVQVSTPRMVLCSSLVTDALTTHKQIIAECRQRALLNVPYSSHFNLQLCLSVKTQPQTAVLLLSRDQSYLGECISLAEIRACLACGYSPGELVLTGPGKFWDNVPRGEPMPSILSKAAPLRAVFADSLADLTRIVHCILDPAHWLNCEVVGVRFAAAWHVESRFGLDSRDPSVLLQAAQLLHSLPERIKIGTHFHHASSNLGSTAWFDLAQAFLVTTTSFAQLCQRDVAVIDFGGGWSADFLSQGITQEKLAHLLAGVAEIVPNLSTWNTAAVSNVTVQFELGKCISERAGGVLTRVLEVREVSQGPQERARSAAQRAPCGVILDATMGDVSAVNTYPHPVMWRDPVAREWRVLQPGPDHLWGRSCMEFEKLGEGISAPEGIKEGDLVVIACTGAYDSSMQYSFGDGRGRESVQMI